MAVVRGYGTERAVAFAQDKNIQKALEELIADLEREHRRRVEVNGERPLRDHIADLRIERIADSLMLKNVHTRTLGADLLYTAEVEYPCSQES